MKKLNTKITLSAIALSAVLLQGCAGEILRVTTQEIAMAIANDVITDKIRTNFSEDDFGSINNNLLLDNQAVYVSFKNNDASSICSVFKNNTKSLKKQYDCYATKEDTQKQDGSVYLQVAYSSGSGFLVGRKYQLTYKNIATGKTDTFISPGFFKQSQIIKYAAEYLSRLAQKANETN